MATVQKKPRKLPKIKGKDEKNEPVAAKDQRAGKGDASRGTKRKELPPPGKTKELPPLRKGGRKGDSDSKSLVDMNRNPLVEVDHRTALTANTEARSCFFYIDDDPLFSGIKLVIHPKKHRKLDTVTQELSRRMRSLPFGVRSIYTPRAQHRIHNLEDFTAGGNYVCSSNRKFARGLDVARVRPTNVWHHMRPDSGKGVLNNLLKDFVELRSDKQMASFRPSYELSQVYTKVPPKKVTVMKNGGPDEKHMLLLNRRTAQTYEQVLKSLSDNFGFAVRKLFTIDGHIVDGLQTMLNGPEVLVAAGKEPFIKLNMEYSSTSRAGTRMSTNMGSHVNLQNRLQSRRNRHAATKGRWKVTVRTNALPSAGTQAQVTINVYGSKGNSGPITLGRGDGRNFQPGQVDEFDISVGNVGDVYKIRLAHDNSGDFPGWLCDEIHMHDIDTGEDLTFSCRRWLARDEDDQEITRELAVKRPGDPILPLIKYQVDVQTGDMWGGGTEANIYITLYGDRGDTGVRQLYAETKGVYFKQGQLDSFEVEAVSLGHLQRIIIGHDGTGPGAGWYLDKVTIREPPFGPNQEHVFHCGQWLDEGEDDGKIVRERRRQDAYMDDILEKRNWEMEKWKYEKDCQVMLYSVMTGKALRFSKDLTVDGVGGEKDRHAVFRVVPKKPMKPMFESAAIRNHFMAIDGGRISGSGKGGPYCEFRARVQQDRTTLFESVKNALQFLTIGADGAPAEVRGILDKDPTRRFYVYAKGCFRHKGVIMLCTSQHQCINLNQDENTLTGRGKRAGPLAQFRVHKVSSGGIRMFESVATPGSFIRLKDGKIDCVGKKDPESYFLVLRHKDKGYITLQSASQRGLFLGMTNDGKVHTTIDTGVRNIWLYPEVVEWGMPKKRSTEVVEEEAMAEARREMTPVSMPATPPSPKPSSRQFADSAEKTSPIALEKSKYSVEIITDTESGPCNVAGGVHITLYGDKGKTPEIKLYASDPTKKTFEPGNIDQFTLDTEPLGDLYKIRLGRDDSDKWERWFLDEVRLTDVNTGEKMVFSYKRWLARDMDDGDLCRELPVVHPGKPSPVLQQYQVQVLTGDHWGASTDANVYITVYGTRGDSGKRLLHKCINNRVKFRRGQVDTFEFDIVDLEEPTSVVISHDGRGHGAGIFVEKVVIKEKEGSRSHVQYVFPCGRWLDDHEEDCLTERTLNMIDSIESTKPTPPKESKKSSGNWLATVKSSSLVKSPTTANVYLTVYGTSGHSGKKPLTRQDQSTDVFSAGSECQFQIKTDDVGKVTKVRLEHDNSGSTPDWRVDYVKLLDTDTNEELVFYLDRWLAMDQDDGQICREMPVIRKGAPSLPVLRYIVALTTGSYKDSGTESGSISINLIGVDGDTGMRELNGPISKNRLPWQSGQTDIFVLEAVSVGKIKKMELNFTSAAQERWYVQQVGISEGSTALTQFVCNCHQWMLASDTQVAEFPVTELQPSTSLINRLDSIPKGLEKTVKTKGRWTVYVQTGTQNDSGTKEKVCIVLCGLMGESGPVHVNAKDELNPGSFVKFEAKVSDIGLLFKVRVYFEEKHHGSSWFLSKMKLKDQDTGEELHFEHNDWIESTNENPEGALELAVVRPDLEPLKDQIYIVSVRTDDLPLAETEASVFCQLIGQWGSTGQRSLAVSSNTDLFRAGQVDEFTLTCIDLGEIQKVIIGHDTVGRGQGWFCRSVTVKVAEEMETIFPCNRWLDTGCDDRKLSVELLPLTRQPLSYHQPSKYKQSKDGKWNFHITTASLDKLNMVKPGQSSGDISIVVYGSNSVKGPIELMDTDQGSRAQLLCPGKTEHYYNYELEDIGEIEKIRVSSGYEGDTEAVWTIQQVELEEQASHDILTFDFRGWVGELGGDIRKEMSLMLPDNSNRQIIQYYIEVHTSDAELNAATNSNVFITLYGSNSDSGRRHLIKSKNTTKRFQTGQYDKFELKAIDLGDLQKLVVAKGPGKPWLLEKIVVKKGEFAAEEHVFLFDGWIGDKNRQDDEIEESLKLTATIPSYVAIPQEEAPDLNPSNGSWTIESMTGGRRGPDSPLDAIVVFCGQNGESKPVPLQSNRENPFQIGQSDIFKVKYGEQIGELRKVRLGFIDQATTKAWFVKKITFKDEDSHDVFWAELGDWIAVDNKLDGWKEIPVPWPAVQLPPVVRYVVSINVGQVGGAEGQSGEVYIHMYGEQGGTGRRLLKHSISNTEMIRENQVDVFEVEAVHLGDLVKVVVGHSSTKKGSGWYLERVIVQESPEAEEILFECNRWLDAGEDDGVIERTLHPIQMYHKLDDQNQNNSNAQEVIVPLLSSKPSTPEHEQTPVESPDIEIKVGEEMEEAIKETSPVPQGTTWSVTTTTGGGAGEGTGSVVIVILYGDKGHSSPCLIGEEEDFRFSTGNTDTFNIQVSENIGELFKVRLGFLDVNSNWYSDIDAAPTWFLEKLTLRNKDDQKMYEFDAGLWVRINEYQDFWRELPVKGQGNQLEVYQYKVSVYTGEVSQAGTDANVYLQIFGECGDTGYRKLMTSKTNSNKFEKGNKDVFELGAVDMGKLTKLKIRHDGSGPGSGWLLDRIVIQETEETTIRYVFRYERWLDESDGVNGVEQTLNLSEILVSDEEDQKEDLPGYPWKVQTVTGDETGEGTSCPVELVFCEENGHCQSVFIGEKEDFVFNAGATDTFNVRVLEDIKYLYKVRIGFHGAKNEERWLQDFTQAPSWFLEQLKVTDETTGREYEIQMPTWLRMDDFQDYWREQPAIHEDAPMPEVYQYQVEVYTGDESKAGTDANIFLSISGQKGDTGMRRLMGSKTHSNKFEQGNCDRFELNAVDLGDLTKVTVSHDGAGMGSGWYLHKIVVKETEKSLSKYVFNCGKWLDAEEWETTVTQEFPLSDVQEQKAEEEENIPGNPWTVWSVTGSDVGEGTDNAVELVLYGNLGHSSPVIIGAADNFRFDKGQIDVFEVKVVEEIGELYKVRVGFHGGKYEVPWFQNYHLAPSWFIESLKLKDEACGKEYELEAGVSVQVEKYTDFWRELPVINTDNKLQVNTYHVEIYTGEKFKAGTDANVSLQIYGERGDTGLRRLMESKTNLNKFEGGEKDVFEIPAVDLGQLTKVKVSHDGSGSGSGWLLDKVVVKVTEDAMTQFVFNCGKWLDEGEGEEDVEITLPLTDITETTLDAQEEEPPTTQHKEGDWKVFVTTSSEPDSGTDSNVTLTVYGDADNTGPLPLGQPNIGFFYSGKTDEFDVFLDPEDLGQLRKIRLEHDNSGRPWQVEKVVMVNLMDRTEIEFPINKWLTLEEKGFDIAVEAPTKGHDWPVRDYVVQTLTGDGFGSGTDATVYINLIGTLGDSGKRYLVHNMEGTEDKFACGQKDKFIVQAVDIGRLVQVQIGHTGRGPGSGWFLKTVTVKESYDAEDKYIFSCNQWLHDEKEDGLTERLLSLESVKKDSQLFVEPERDVEATQDNENQGAPQAENNTHDTNEDDNIANETDTELPNNDQISQINDDDGKTNQDNDENVKTDDNEANNSHPPDTIDTDPTYKTDEKNTPETEDTKEDSKYSPVPEGEHRSQTPEVADGRKSGADQPSSPKEKEEKKSAGDENDAGQLDRERSETYRVNNENK